MAEITQTSTPLPFKLAPFTGVNNASARLLKAISQFELNSLNWGDVVYVESVYAYWKWLPLDTQVDDTATEVTICAPTVVGVGAGRFVRLDIASPEVMNQTEWNISSAGNNEATGLVGAPFLTTAERRRRMGPNAAWKPSTAYHIRLLTDGLTDTIQGIDSGSNTVIYFHASVNDFEGASTLYIGSVTSIILLNTATGQCYVVNSAGLAVNWTGLIDARMRVTSGANVRALSSPFFQDAVTAKSAWCDEFLTPAASLSVAPFSAPASTQAPPSAGDTFVIEALRVVTRIHIDLRSPPGGAITTTRIVLDGIQTTVSGADACGVYCYGSRVITPFSALPALITHRSCLFVGNGISDTGLKSIIGGHIIAGGSLTLINNQPTSSVITNFTLNGASVLGFGGSGSQLSPDTWRPGQIGIHNHTTSSPYLLLGQGVRMSSTWLPYGLANTVPLMVLEQNVIGINQAGTWTMPGFNTTSPNIWQPGPAPARTSIPAFDQTTSIFTAPRLLSVANMQATVLAGGFDYNVEDPVSGCGFAKY